MNYIDTINLNNINNTILCNIMTKSGSDKGDNKNHNYTKLYHYLFDKMRNKPIKLFELGLGTNNINIPSNMGINGIPGASLRGWLEYFNNDNTIIYGADIDKNILFQTDRIKTYYCDQTDINSILNMWNEIDECFDIIIEDGLHEFEANLIFLENSIHKLKKNGIYIVEDLCIETINKFVKIIDNIKEKYNLSCIEVIKIQNNFNYMGNNLLYILK
jgi:hypothetical protein